MKPNRKGPFPAWMTSPRQHQERINTLTTENERLRVLLRRVLNQVELGLLKDSLVDSIVEEVGEAE